MKLKKHPNMRRPIYHNLVIDDLCKNLEAYEVHRIEVNHFLNRIQDMIDKIQNFIVSNIIYYNYSEYENKTILFSTLYRLLALLNKHIDAKKRYIVYNIQLDNFISNFKNCILSLNNRLRQRTQTYHLM